VAYTSDWEPLADALKRVMATGASEDEAKIDLCRAVADRKIDVRVRIAASDDRCFSNGNVRVPTHLSPGDLDWVQSRPLAQWSIGPKLVEHYTWFENWKVRPLDLIELSTADVMNVLCGDDGANDNARGKSEAIIKHETAATRALGDYLKTLGAPNTEPLLTRDEAAKWCSEKGFKLGGRGFQRVWLGAREHAGLPLKAPPGAKRKSPR